LCRDFPELRLGTTRVSPSRNECLIAVCVRGDSNDAAGEPLGDELANEDISFSIVQVVVDQDRVKGAAEKLASGRSKAGDYPHVMAAKELAGHDLREGRMVLDEQ